MSKFLNLAIHKMIFIMLLVIVISGVSHAEEDYFNILLDADKARGNHGGIAWKVNIQSKNKHKLYYVRALGFDLLAETLSPAKYKGNKILMVSGNMWFHKPGLSKPVPISRRQKLLGEASYGDISSTNYAQDYTIETVSSVEFNTKACWLFDLKSKTKKNSYDRIHYWVDKRQHTGIKADYFSVSGKRIKSAFMRYLHSVVVEGKNQPFISQITIIDGIKTESITVMELTEPELKEIPGYYFNVNFLRR